MIAWPKLKRDRAGARVRLLRTIRTRGGEVFRKGRILEVSGCYGEMHLRSLVRVDGFYRSISGVADRYVELVSLAPPKAAP